ncbi:MAG TPA: hypothetical protein VGO46_11655 [Gemmatimonadaceae bacterium]|nr:hypothetical protein [Gemmatimonadaceae bacterium]
MADQNQNPGSKQADGESDKSKTIDKDSMGGSGGRTGSGVGRGNSADKSSGGASDMSAGSKNESEEAEEG